MKTITRIETNTENVQFGFWDIEKSEFVPIDTTKKADMELAVERFGCSEALIDALGMMVESLTEAVCEDLQDVWKRLDARA